MTVPYYISPRLSAKCKLDLIALFAGLLLPFCLVTAAQAADGDVDPFFMTGSGVNGGVQTVAIQPDGKVLIGGWFTVVNGVPRNRVARLNPDGSLDMTFNPGVGADGEVRSIVLQPDGKVLIGGLFTKFNNVTRNRIARLNSDGSLDTTFDPGVGANNIVHAVGLQADGSVLIGGAFTNVNGSSSNFVARLTQNGGFDSSFNIGSGASAPVHVITLQTDGKILLGGRFSSYNSTSRNRVVRINTDGSLDASFDPGSGANNFAVYDVTLQPDGKILICGDFSSVNGTTRNAIARLNTNGTLDSTFDPGAGPDFEVYSIAVQSDNKILIGGLFTDVSSSGRQRIARLESNGTLDASFNASNQVDGQVFDVIVLPDGKIVIGGWFISGFDPHFPNRIAKLNANGSVDTSFAVRGGVDNDVYSIVVQPDGKILIGGIFQEVGAMLRSCIARVNADGSPDTTFIPTPGANNSVRAIALQPDGKVLIGGSFGMVNQVSRSRVARLNSDGSLDTSFDPGTGAAGGGLNPGVTAIAVQPDGKIVIGGLFETINGVTRRNIARLNSDGSLDSSFNSGIPAPADSNSVGAIALQPDGKILIGGSFESYDGSPFRSIARLNANGSLDASFNPGSGADSGVYAIALQRDGKTLIGGSFNSFNGGTSKKLARLNTDGSLDTSFSIGLDHDIVSIFDLALQRDGKVLIAGTFDQIGNVGRNGFARLHPYGSLDLSFQSGPTDVNGDVYAIALQPNGWILVGGSFRAFNQFERFRLARLLTTAKTGLADFDGDARTDISVFRPSDGSWYLLRSTAGFTGVQFGVAGDVPVAGDYDGDGVTDIAVWRPSSGTWYLLQSTAGFTGVQFGQSGDVPVPGDADGDGKTDIRVFRPSNGYWYRLNSSNGQFVAEQFGANGDLPVVGDYDGDGLADLAVFRPSTGSWYLLRTTAGFTGVQFGQDGDKPVAGDFDGDGRSDIALFRPSNGGWYLQRSTAGFTGVQFGLSSDLPSPGDYDGDGKTDIAVFRPSSGAWYLLRSTAGFTGVQFGLDGDVPVPAAYLP